VTKARPGIKRGRMSAEEKAEIERLATTLKDPRPGPIARRLNRDHGTIYWHLITRGLIEIKLRYGGSAYRRGDRTVRRFTREEDRRLLELRTQGNGFVEIARILAAEFGTERNHHCVRVRCIMLAAAVNAPDLAAEAAA
jgi:IS30 family transposase